MATRQQIAKKMVGYQRRDSISHRKYDRTTSINRYKRTGKFVYVKDGSGHRAGEKWGDDKEINPDSTITKYSKNSPSFDEGVYLSKKKRGAQIELSKQSMANKMLSNLQ